MGVLDSLAGGPIGGLAGIGGGVISSLEANKQRERERRTRNDELRLQAQQLALKAAEFNRNAPQVRIQNALRGDVLAGIQPYQLTGEGRTLGATGGLTPALISAGSRQLGQDIARRALLSELGQSPGGPPPMAGLTAPPPRRPGLFGHLQDVEQQLQARAGYRGSALPLPDPYTFQLFGGRPLRGGPDSLWGTGIYGQEPDWRG